MSIWFENDKKLPQARLAAVSYGIVALIGLLLFGFWNLQVIRTTYYAGMAERNRVRSIPIIAPRGSILDREGRVLVDNYPSFSVLLLRDDPKLLQSLLPQIADGLGVTLADLQQQIDAAKTLPNFQPIVIKPEASPADIDFIESHRPDIPVLEMMMVHRRRYAYGEFLAHAIGYVGEVSTEDITASDGQLRSGDIVGKSGLEKQYDETLKGTDGLRRSIVNSVGKEVGQLEQQDPIPGKPIRLTIDYDLQSVAEQAMTGKVGAVVALDPRTGEVLAMVSQPAYNPSDFAVSIPRQEWDQLNDDPEKPLLNRAIQAQLAPGSIFKIFETTAMLESKAIPADFRVFCPGYATFYGRVFHDAEKPAHGNIGLHDAIVHSCDVYFYNVGQRLGIDRISYYGTSLGLGRKTGIDLPGEDSGLMPSEAWKERVFHQKWYPGETISLAIGQGATEATPLQIAYTIGGIISGGVFKQPHLLMSSQPAPEIDFPISESTTDFVTQAMYGVVNEGGTAGAVKLPGIEFCGKTGTAQVISTAGKEKATNKSALKNNAWFVGFAPRRNAEIVVAVLVQAGGYGAEAAAPVARDIVKAYYDKKGGTYKGPQDYATNPNYKKPQPGDTTVMPTATAQATPVTASSASRP
ncbi:MAG: penicillin-binding protein 2 [Candidatus Acidiferrales bacterium]